MWHQLGKNPSVGKPLINSSYVLQWFSRERDSTYTSEVNILTCQNKSRDLLYEDDT